MTPRETAKQQLVLLQRKLKRLEREREQHGESEFARGFTLGEAYAKRVAQGGTKLDGE